jgi:hypothetical protein
MKHIQLLIYIYILYAMFNVIQKQVMQLLLKNVDLKTGFLRFFFGRLIEVKRTIPLFINVINIKLGRQINISFISCF